MNRRFVTYIDKQGKEYDALVLVERGLDGEYLTLAIAVNGEPEKLIDIPHANHESRAETNPDLPHKPLNCWMDLPPSPPNVAP